MLTLFGYVLKNLGRQKLRTVLICMGVVFGVWLVVIFATISAGTLRTAEAMLSQFGEDFHCYKAGVADQFLSTLPEKETREELRALPGVRDTASVSMWVAPASGIPFVLVLGLRPGEFALDELAGPAAASFSSEDAAEVLLGRALEKRIGLGVGDGIEVQGIPCTIVGTYSAGHPLYDNMIVVPLAIIQAIRGSPNTANFIAVRVEEGADPVEVAARAEAEVPGVAAVGTIDELSKVDKSLERMKTIGVVISVAATVIGLFFVLLAMVMSVVERTREVGVLRAVGWTKGRIVLVVLIEAVVLSLIGAIVGIPTGLAGVEAIAWLTELGSYIEPTYEATLFVKAFGVAMFAAVIGGIYPAWRAARLRPVEALRHE